MREDSTAAQAKATRVFCQLQTKKEKKKTSSPLAPVVSPHFPFLFFLCVSAIFAAPSSLLPLPSSLLPSPFFPTSFLSPTSGSGKRGWGHTHAEGSRQHLQLCWEEGRNKERERQWKKSQQTVKWLVSSIPPNLLPKPKQAKKERTTPQASKKQKPNTTTTTTQACRRWVRLQNRATWQALAVVAVCFVREPHWCCRSHSFFRFLFLLGLCL